MYPCGLKLCPLISAACLKLSPLISAACPSTPCLVGRLVILADEPSQLLPGVGAQVQKLSDGDAEETTRLLYNRNVSSSKLLDESASEPLPEPKRMAGNIINFKRSAVSLCIS